MQDDYDLGFQRVEENPDETVHHWDAKDHTNFKVLKNESRNYSGRLTLIGKNLTNLSNIPDNKDDLKTLEEKARIVKALHKDSNIAKGLAASFLLFDDPENANYRALEESLKSIATKIKPTQTNLPTDLQSEMHIEKIINGGGPQVTKNYLRTLPPKETSPTQR